MTGYFIARGQTPVISKRRRALEKERAAFGRRLARYIKPSAVNYLHNARGLTLKDAGAVLGFSGSHASMVQFKFERLERTQEWKLDRILDCPEWEIERAADRIVEYCSGL